MSIFDQASKDITAMEDARVFFEVATGHSVPNWGWLGGRHDVYGGSCDRCGEPVRSDVDKEAAENECVYRRVEEVHAY